MSYWTDNRRHLARLARRYPRLGIEARIAAFDRICPKWTAVRCTVIYLVKCELMDMVYELPGHIVIRGQDIIGKIREPASVDPA